MADASTTIGIVAGLATAFGTGVAIDTYRHQIRRDRRAQAELVSGWPGLPNQRLVLRTCFVSWSACLLC
jgi:hypothetical protein